MGNTVLHRPKCTLVQSLKRVDLISFDKVILGKKLSNLYVRSPVNYCLAIWFRSKCMNTTTIFDNNMSARRLVDEKNSIFLIFYTGLTSMIDFKNVRSPDSIGFFT